jgi:hypothetical protein
VNKKIPIAIVFIALFAISSISLAVANATVASTTNMGTNVQNALAQRSYIRINGVISQWGTTTVTGTLQTQAGTSMRTDLSTNQLAAATAIWTTNTSRPISAVQAKQNFTYTFYEARLRNASVSTLSASSASTNYFLNGTWNVYTVVSSVTVLTNANGQITSVHRNSQTTMQQAYGELNVTDNWTKFTLSITGIDQLSGSVFASVQRQVQFNPFKVTDDSVTTAANKADIAAVIHAYGAMPGWGNYDARMDFCGHFKIDIADLSTVAANT